MEKTRRRLLQGIAATGFAVGTGTMNAARAQGTQPDLVLRNGQFTTLDRSNPQANAVAIKDGRFVAVGQEREVMALAGSGSKVIDLKGRRAIPGLIDSHTHIIRGGLNYNMELRWDGVRSLADAMSMLKRQIAVTPPPQWVRVVGGFTERQFAEKRLPTIEELNAAAPDTPVFILHLYDRALLNGAALRAVGYTKDTPEIPGGLIQRDPPDLTGTTKRCSHSDGAGHDEPCYPRLWAAPAWLHSAHGARGPSRGPDGRGRDPEGLAEQV